MATVLSLALVLAADGSVDTDASLASARTEILKYKAERETEMEVIGDTVGAIFDQYKGATLNMPFVQNETCRRLNATPENFKVLQERSAEYVRAHSQGKKIGEGDSATWEHPDSLFVISKGKGGGVSRRADAPAKPAAE